MCVCMHTYSMLILSASVHWSDVTRVSHCVTNKHLLLLCCIILSYMEDGVLNTVTLEERLSVSSTSCLLQSVKEKLSILGTLKPKTQIQNYKSMPFLKSRISVTGLQTCSVAKSLIIFFILIKAVVFHCICFSASKANKYEEAL